MRYLPNTMLLKLKRIFNKPEPAEIPQEPIPMKSSYTLLNRKDQAKIITDRLMALDTPADDRRNAARELKLLRTQNKVSWEKLGVSQDQLRMVEVLLVNEPKPAKPSKKTRAIAEALHGGKPEAAAAKSTNAQIRAMRDAEVQRLDSLGFSKTNIAHRMGISRDTVITILRPEMWA